MMGSQQNVKLLLLLSGQELKQVSDALVISATANEDTSSNTSYQEH